MKGRRRSHSPSVGVMLQGRTAGLNYSDDEIRRHGKWSPQKLHRRVRAREKAALRRALSKGDDGC